jgi:hypothetical protein
MNYLGIGHNRKYSRPAFVSEKETESLRRLNREELEFILIHEEPRRVLKTAAIAYYGHYYRVRDEYIKRRVWTRLKGTNLEIECDGHIIARYALRQERYQDIPRTGL